MNNILVPSMLAIDFGHMERELKKAVEAGVKCIHVDIMDGNFVPNISFGPPVVKYVRKAVPDAFLDVHMMVVNPARYIEKYADLGAGMITIHLEATEDIRGDLLKIKALGTKVGVAISPDTPVSAVEPVIDIVDMVLVMTVYPGFGGQQLIPESMNRIKRVREMANKLNSDLNIEVDGGITLDNVSEILDAGANVIVAGSSVFGEHTSKNAKAFLDILGGSYSF